MPSVLAEAAGETWQNGPALEWLAKIALPPTPAQELAGGSGAARSLGAIAEESETVGIPASSVGPSVPALFLVGPLHGPRRMPHS